MNNNKLTIIKNALKSTLTSISPSAELVNKLYLDSHLVAIKISKTIQEKYSLSWDTLKLLYVAKDLFLVYYPNISSIYDLSIKDLFIEVKKTHKLIVLPPKFSKENRIRLIRSLLEFNPIPLDNYILIESNENIKIKDFYIPLESDKDIFKNKLRIHSLNILLYNGERYLEQDIIFIRTKSG